MSEVRAADDAAAFRVATAIVVVATVIRLIFAALLPLFPDETYYWDWSRHLAAGYFDHPSGIAVLIAAGTSSMTLLGAGHSAFAVRLFPVIAGGVASGFAMLLAARIGGGRAARRAALLFALMPLAASGLVLATPDAPLLATVAGALYALVRAIESPPRSAAALRWWIVAGVWLGLAFSSKYTSILLPATVVAALLARRDLRARLTEPGPWIACVVATIVFLPVLHWNATHDWISFRFQIQHGLGTPKGSVLKRELDLVGGQLGLVSPILFALAAHAVWRAIRRPATDVQFLLAMVAVGSWIFFGYSAMRRSVEANWPAPAYVPALALLAAGARSRLQERWLRGGMALAALMVVVIYLHSIAPVLPLPARRDPVARSAGWGGLATQVQQARNALGGRTHVGADRYQDVSELAYHLADQPAAFCTCFSGRHNQYELWPRFESVARPGDNLVLALEDTTLNAGSPTRLRPHFDRVSAGVIVPLLRGHDTVAVRRVWSLQGYRGGWPLASSPGQ